MTTDAERLSAAEAFGKSTSVLRAVWVGGFAALLVATIAQAETLTYTYGARGQMKSAATSGGATVTYTYDANGNRTQKVTTGGTAPVNVAPVAVNDSRSTNRNTAITFDPRSNDSDPNGDAFTITAKTNGTQGTVAISAGGVGVTYTPTTGYSGADSFTYTISDGSLTATATVAMTVLAPANNPPVAVDDTYNASGVGALKMIEVIPQSNDTDADGHYLRVTVVTPVSGTATAIILEGGDLIRISNINIGTHVLNYTVSDGNGGTDVGTITVTRSF